MWMSRLVRKALALKEDELKAFFIKASVRQKQQGDRVLIGAKGWPWAKGHAAPPQSWVLPSAQEHRKWVMDTGTSSRRQLAPGEGLDLPAVTPWPFPVLASQMKWARGPHTAEAETVR